MIDVNKIITKNKWSGKDIGLLKIANKTDFKRRTNAGDYTPEPLILPSDLEYMASTLSEKELNILDGFDSLCYWMENYALGASTMTQQAQGRYLYINSWLEKAAIVENALSYMERLPVVMTQEQYDREVKENLPLLMADPEDDAEYVFSLQELILYAANALRKDLNADKRKANPLKPIRKKYLSEEITLPEILDNYNEITGKGYYKLSDGRRSDQMSTKEWRAYAAKVSGVIDGLIRTGRIRFEIDGRETAKAVQRAFLQKENILRDEDLYEDLPFEWVKDTEQPEKLNKWEAFESDLDEYDLTPEELIMEFPEIVSATIKEIEERDYFDISLSNVPIEKWDDIDSLRFSYRDLYERDFFGFKEKTDFDAATLYTGSRGNMFGVAILKQNPDLKDLPLNVDQQGDYFAPSTYEPFEQNGLGAFFDEAPNSSLLKGEIMRSRQEFIMGAYYTIAYDRALREVMQYLKIDDLDCYIILESHFTRMINTLTRSYRSLKAQIHLAQYSKELKIRKLEILEELFAPIDRKALDIPEEIIEEVRKAIKDNFRFFADNKLQLRLLAQQPIKE